MSHFSVARQAKCIKKPETALYMRLPALLLMVPKARIELARPWATAPSRQFIF